MKTIVILILLSIVSLVVLNSYDKSVTPTEMSAEKQGDVLKTCLIQEYAQTLALSLNNETLRTQLKREAMKMFDGDYDVLSSRFESLQVTKNGEKIEDILAQSNNTLNKQSLQTLKKQSLQKDVNYGKEFLAKAAKYIPNLQIAVPVHCDEWDTKNHIPLVAYLPYDYNEKTTKFIKAYDHKGGSHKLSLDVEPSVPVIVVGRSERVDEKGNMLAEKEEVQIIEPRAKTTRNKITIDSKTKGKDIQTPQGPASLTLSHGVSRSVILQWSDVADETSYEVWRMHEGENQFWKFATTGQNNNTYINEWIRVGAKVWYKVRAKNNFGYSAWSPVMATTVSERNDNEWLKIKRMRFSKTALNAVEKWVSGAPEIRLRVVQGVVNGALTVYTSGRMEPGRRRDIENRWWNKEVSLFSWSTNTYGTVFTFDWREEDPYDEVTFTISGSYEDKGDNGTIKYGGSLEFSGDAGGGHIGNTSVLWWHTKSQIYNISGFEWQFEY